MGGTTEPEVVAKLVSFLIGPDSSGVTGRGYVDGCHHLRAGPASDRLRDSCRSARRSRHVGSVSTADVQSIHRSRGYRHRRNDRDRSRNRRAPRLRGCRGSHLRRTEPINPPPAGSASCPPTSPSKPTSNVWSAEHCPVTGGSMSSWPTPVRVERVSGPTRRPRIGRRYWTSISTARCSSVDRVVSSHRDAVRLSSCGHALAIMGVGRDELGQMGGFLTLGFLSSVEGGHRRPDEAPGWSGWRARSPGKWCSPGPHFDREVGGDAR